MSVTITSEPPTTNGLKQSLDKNRVCRCGRSIPDEDTVAHRCAEYADSLTEFDEEPCPFTGEKMAKYEPTGVTYWVCEECQENEAIYASELVCNDDYEDEG